MQHRPLVFIDIETTGASARNSRVLEIGALRMENYRVIDTFSTLLSVDRPIPSFITNLTGINDSMTINAPRFSDISNDLRSFMDNTIFIAHNVGFDYSFLQMEYRKINQTLQKDRLCTVQLSRTFYPEQSRHNLDTIIQTHGFSVDNRHRALDDAQVLVDFFQKIIETNGIHAFTKIDKLIRYVR